MIELSSQAGFGEADLAQSKEVATPDADFAALVHRQSRFVYRVAYAIVRNIQDAEDVAQETFLKLYRNRSWRDIQDERAFLARAAWRMAVERCAKRESATFDQPEAQSQSSTPEQLALNADWNARIHALIDALPEELRQPLALSALDDLNSSQIARILGIPDGTVRSRLLRARQILKAKLKALAERGSNGK